MVAAGAPPVAVVAPVLEVPAAVEDTLISRPGVTLVPTAELLIIAVSGFAVAERPAVTELPIAPLDAMVAPDPPIPLTTLVPDPIFPVLTIFTVGALLVAALAALVLLGEPAAVEACALALAAVEPPVVELVLAIAAVPGEVSLVLM